MYKRQVVTSGIICDNPVLLKVFKDNNVAIAADDVAHESRAFRTDASEEGDPMMALSLRHISISPTILIAHEDANMAVGGAGIVGGMNPKGYVDKEAAEALIQAQKNLKTDIPGTVSIH